MFGLIYVVVYICLDSDKSTYHLQSTCLNTAGRGRLLTKRKPIRRGGVNNVRWKTVVILPSTTRTMKRTTTYSRGGTSRPIVSPTCRHSETTRTITATRPSKKNTVTTRTPFNGYDTILTASLSNLSNLLRIRPRTS